AIFAEAAQGYSALGPPLSHIKSVGEFNLLGDHFSPALAVLAPLYALWPSVLVLLLAQAALIGLASGIITRAGTQFLGPTAGVIFGVIYAIACGTQGVGTFDFHEVALALPLVAMVYLKVLQEEDRAALCWAAGLVLVKEDSVFVLLGLALVFLAKRKFTLAVVVTGYALSTFIATVYLIIPHFSFYGRYTYFDSSSVNSGTSFVESVVANVATSISSGSLVQLLAILLLPTLGASCNSPILLGGVPLICAKFTTATEIYWSSSFHYNSVIVVIVTMAAIDGLRRLRGRLIFDRGQRAWAAGAITVSLAVGYGGSAVALLHNTRDVQENYGEVSRALDQIPDGAKVAVSDTVAPYLVDRTQVFGMHDGLRDSSGSGLAVTYLAIDRHIGSPQLIAWLEKNLKAGRLRTLGEARIYRRSGDIRFDLLVVQVVAARD
ncbi:MAG: DUF2079 domain-containing protein, partial [Angustibacter sp.]